MLTAFILGIAARSFFDLSGIFILACVVLAVSLLSIFWKNKLAAVAAFLVLSFVLGIFVLDSKLDKIQNYPFLEKNISQEAVIIKEPERKETYQKITAKVGNEKILINAGLYPEYAYGDKVSVDCDLKIPENKDESFDYKMYLAKDGIRYVCEKATLEKISGGTGNIAYASILKIKNRLQENIATAIPQPEASLASGVLFGGSGSMSKGVQENFSKTGMTHIVAVSGYNVTIIAEYLVILGIFLGLWRKQALWFAIFGIFLFVAMIGFPSSAVRAGVMGTVLIWAMKSGRLANSQNAVILAGAVMLFINPMLLRWDVGFQLSFLATLGIVEFSPLVEKMQIRKHSSFGILEIILLTISAQVFVLPVIISNFGSVSLVSLLANILILPVIPISMLLSFLTSISGFVLASSYNVFAWIAYFPLRYEIGAVNYLADLPWSNISGINMPLWITILYYVLLGIFIVFLRRKYYAK